VNIQINGRDKAAEKAGEISEQIRWALDSETSSVEYMAINHGRRNMFVP
jgi:hypothetical protein